MACTPNKNRPTHSWMEVHVFGSSSEGEGLILRLPDSRYAVVDCCYQGDISDCNSNPMVAFLKARRVKRLAFVCLTHPHKDHYYGLSQILSSMPADEYWRSSALAPSQLLSIVSREEIDALRNGDTARQRAVRELIKIDEVWKEISRGKSPTRLLANRDAYPSVLPKNSQFKIRCISPCDQEISGYEDMLKKCLQEDELTGKSFYLPHNMISLGLLIECKKFSLILGGDMEKKNWEYAVQTIRNAKLKSRFIKISHHGSENGQCEGLWDLLGKTKPIAVVTGYSRKNLPRPEMIETFKKHTSELSCTHRKSVPATPNVNANLQQRSTSRSKVEKFFAVDNRISDLATGFQAVEKTEEATYGRCSYYFDKNGNLDMSEADWPAVRISQ